MAVRIIGGQAKGRTLHVGRGATTRPTSGVVRSALFSILTPYLEAVSVLDLFAGTGALGIEALSRGAATADFVEQDPRQCTALRRNLETLGLTERARVRGSRVEQAIASLPGPYDLVLMDPPYNLPHLEDLLERIAVSPLVGSGTVLAVEHASRQSLPETSGEMALVKRRSYGDTSISIYQHGGEAW